jgi:hypothetical protein
MFALLASPLAACAGSPANDHSPTDAAVPPPVDAAPIVMRSMLQRPLFGDVHPQNLLIDPNFSVRSAGLGNWQAQASQGTQPNPSFAGSLMSDSPNGIALPVARVADSAMASAMSQLDLVAQVPGGPGPFHLRVWISTLDATQSASVDGATVGLLTALDQKAIQISEDPKQARVIAGRTWHLFAGDITQNLSLGAFVDIDFLPSSNTWLIQAPEFIPKAIDPTPNAELVRRSPPTARTRPMTAPEKAIVARYRQQPRISVPASHPSLDDEPRDLPRR